MAFSQRTGMKSYLIKALSALKNRRMILILIIYLIAVYFMKETIVQIFNYTRVTIFGFSKQFGPDNEDDATNGKLLLVQVLFRHGHRSPFKIYPTDPNPKNLWREGLGQLTKLGRIQHYATGEYLRMRYKSFLTSNPHEVHCLSSGAERCLYGAYALLAGLYPPPPDRMIHENLHWQPISVEYHPESKDKYLQSTPNCPASDNEKKRMIASPEGKAFIKKHKHLYELWSNASGLHIKHYDNAGSLYKTLYVEKTLNLVIPKWAEETWDQLAHQGDMCYYFHFRSKIIHRLRAGPIIERMLENMRTKMRDPTHTKKIYLYSGHGSNIAAVLQALRMFNNKIPPYTAFVLFELYQRGHEHSIRLLYSNITNPEENMPEPDVLILPDCTEYCPMEYFEKYTKNLIPMNWKKECNAEKRISSKA